MIQPRVLIYTLEHRLLSSAMRLLGRPVEPELQATPEQLRLIQSRLAALVPLVRVRNPMPLPQRVALHLQGLWKVIQDLPSLQRRKVDGNDNDFSGEIRERMRDFPAYYRRNYHHQTDGYFSVESAQRYDHQLELVFSGLGWDIRQAGASQLRRFLPPDGRYDMIELGAGTGELSVVMQQLFPGASILTTDPSVHGLQWAKRKYPGLRVRGEPTFMEDLSFCGSSSVDVAFSSFVWHEVPPGETRTALAEIARVLRKGGYLLWIDAVQDCDGEENVFVLDHFPKTFHEPYFPEYRRGDHAAAVRALGFEVVHQQTLFFSKVVIARKQAEPGEAA
jgi:ubiquinone/menaquinone biosynthesis C-methylase UbiE